MSEGKKMSHDEMMQFIMAVGRSELFDELRALKLHHRSVAELQGSYYMKAVRATLCALGYDCRWVDSEFRGALEDYYDELVEKEMIQC